MTSKLKTDVLETVSGSGTIALTNQLSGMTSASMPSGSVLQIVSDIYTGSNDYSTTSNSYVDTQLAVSITPKFANSKILIQMVMNVQSPSASRGESKIMRGSTLLSGYSWIGPNDNH